MKKLFILLVVVFSCVTSSAQQVPDVETNQWTVIFKWSKGPDGFFHKEKGGVIKECPKAIGILTFDKKSREIYAVDDFGCYHVKLEKGWSAYVANYYQPDKLDEQELKNEINQVEFEIDKSFSYKNNVIKTQKDVAQSEENERREKERQAQIEKEQKEIEEYKAENPDYRFVPNSFINKSCMLCHNFSVGAIVEVHGDTIYSREKYDGLFDYTGERYHMFRVDTKNMRKHCNIYADSLTGRTLSKMKIQRLNSIDDDRYCRHVGRKAPNGFIVSWDWSSGYLNTLKMNLTWFNTSKKTIKYLTVYFKMFNDVNDVRKTGKFQGTGPVKYGVSATWEWDSIILLPGDVSTMKITKIEILYMDKSKKVITGKNIIGC